MKRLGVMANTTKARAPDVLRQLLKCAAAQGFEIQADMATAALAAPAAAPAVVASFEAVDAVLALGGDGTMLRAFRSLHSRDIPLIGINIGSLGFLTSLAETELEHALDCLAHDRVTFSRRAVADCLIVAPGGRRESHQALNDVVLSNGVTARAVALEVWVGEERVGLYRCDGLIVSTPTGSTAHNLSAGGPILMPEARAFVLCAICPHTLSTRPLVVSDDRDIVIRPGEAEEHPLHLAVDGQAVDALQGQWEVRVRACAQGIRFIHLPDYSYFRVLSQKLGWKASTGR